MYGGFQNCMTIRGTIVSLRNWRQLAKKNQQMEPQCFQKVITSDYRCLKAVIANTGFEKVLMSLMDGVCVSFPLKTHLVHI